MASPAAGILEDDPRARGIVRRTTAEYLKNHVTQPPGMTQAIFREDVGFVSEDQNQQLELERREIWSEALTEAQKLAVVIADVQKKLCQHDPNFRPINPQTFTLPQLMDALESNRYKYENEDLKGAKGFLRKGFRKMGENAESFKLWLELVPKENLFTAPVVGGFIVRDIAVQILKSRGTFRVKSFLSKSSVSNHVEYSSIIRRREAQTSS